MVVALLAVGATKQTQTLSWQYECETADVSEMDSVVSTAPGNQGERLPDTWHLEEILERRANSGWELAEMTSIPRNPAGHKVVLVFRKTREK